MSRRLVLAVGSPVAGDDLAWRVLEVLPGALAARRLASQGIAFERSDRPGALLAERLRGCSQVVLIDAMQAGLPLGSVRLIRREDLDQGLGPLSSHGFGVAEALGLAEALGDLPARLALIGIEAGLDGPRASRLSCSGEPLQDVCACLEQLLGDSPAG